MVVEGVQWATDFDEGQSFSKDFPPSLFFQLQTNDGRPHRSHPEKYVSQ